MKRAHRIFAGQEKVAISLQSESDGIDHIGLLKVSDDPDTRGTWELLSPPEQEVGMLIGPQWSPNDDRLAFGMRANRPKDGKKSGLYMLELSGMTTSKVTGAVTLARVYHERCRSAKQALGCKEVTWPGWCIH